MAYQLKVTIQEAIFRLKESGWAQRKIARELRIHRETVARYLRLAGQTSDSKPAISTPGSADQNVPFRPPAKSGRQSSCLPYLEAISSKVEAGLSARRIYQDLIAENGFGGGYQAVKRLVRALKAAQPDRVWRVECQPGEEAQVDFGSAAPIINAEGKRVRPWVFRIVLSYSRKAYSEVVLRQSTENFLRCLENAFQHFGGVPKTLNVDNLKAAVLQADWYDPELNPKLQEFCRHYNTVLLPTRPRTPEHKGKIERGIGYVKDNALKGRTFSSLLEQNQHLQEWERTIADLRIHGTTRQQVAARFLEEKPALAPLPAMLFACFEEGRRTVHRDSFVEVAKSYYQVPQEYIGREVWVRWDSRVVRIFNQRWEQLQMHTRLEPGRFSKALGVQGGHGSLEQNCAYWQQRAAALGSPCGQWAQAQLERRGPEALRTLMGLVALTQKHSFKAVNQACAAALSRGVWRLKDVRQLLGHPVVQPHFQFAQEHPLIRNLSEYGLFIQNQNTYEPGPQEICPETTPLGPAQQPIDAPAGSTHSSTLP
jgi:transposase